MSKEESKKVVAFWKSPKKIVIFLYYLLIPSIVISPGNFYSFFSLVGWRNYVIGGYVILGVGVLIFWIFRLFKTKMYILALVLGLVLSPAFTVLYERQYAMAWRDMGLVYPLEYAWTEFTIIFYVIPLTLLVLFALLATFIVTMVRRSIKATKEMNEKQNDKFF